jgi:DNA polymerase-3 subunit alpha
MSSPFVHLHVQSMYSLYDGIGSPDALISRAKELGYDSIALTDRHALYGAVDFYESAHKAGLKPIIGVIVSVAPNKHTDRRPNIDNHTSTLVLLCETNEGYQNLLRLISKSYLEGFYYRPRVDKDLLREHHAGLIALSGDLKGEIPKALAMHDKERAGKALNEYREIFGPEHFFLELVHHPESPSQNEVNQLLTELGKNTGTQLVVSKEAHYLNPDDAEALDVLVCIHDGKTLEDPNRLSLATVDPSLCGPDEIIEAYKHLPEAIENTRKIADRCNVHFELGKNHLPAFDVPFGETEFSHLQKLCDVGLEERYGGTEKIMEAKERLEFELATIERMGFAAYFLIVADYINWAKDNGVIVGPGRGSAAGSIVAYSLRITNLDPLRYGLLFERFLNPDRISMPDIDTDFDDVKRKDVIEYVSNKYGVDRVAGIITFGTMAARAAVRDVGRVLGLTFAEVDRVAKVIPPPVQGRHIPLAKSKSESPELHAMYETDPRVRRLIDLAIRLEGTTRHASQHACGIVIAPSALVEYSPLQKAQGGDVEQVIQYSLHSSEVMGLLKMDFLGLSNLSVIRDALEIIKAVYGDTVDINTIPLDDKTTYDMLGRAETTGVFQLESDGMKKYIRDLKPTVIEDIIAMVALYRPGPMQFIESFIARKHGRERITYIHPLTENALSTTYGLPIYQEQVMQVAKDMAGFTGGQADTLRKAMGKKIAKLMAEMRTKFVDGSMANAVPREKAEAIFKQFEEFAAYGFNKSHAACYALIAYQTAYLKAHYPDAFMAALMNSDISNLDRITIEIEECRRMGLEVLPPDINESFRGFAVFKGSNKVRFGLLAIKGIGEDVVETMYQERKKNGPYKNLEDLVTRIPGKHINRRSLESLIKSGAFDLFGDRNQLFFNIETILEFQKRTGAEASSGQFNLFAASPAMVSTARLNLKPAPPAATRDILSWEKELLGLYVSAHPFKDYGERLAGLFTPIAKLGAFKKDKNVRTGGMITQAKKILTKNNEPMVFTKLEDTTGSIEAVIFPRVYKENSALWEADKTVVVSGRVQEKEGELKFLVETGYEITPDNIDEIAKYITTNNIGTVAESSPAEQAAPHIQAVTVHPRAHLPQTILHKLRTVFDGHPGQYRVYFNVDNAEGQQKILSSYRIKYDELIEKELEAILGPDTVRVEA